MLPQDRFPFGLQEVTESPVSFTYQRPWEFTNLEAKLGQVADGHNDVNPHRIYIPGKSKFKCSHCRNRYTGTRFVMVKEYRGGLKISVCGSNLKLISLCVLGKHLCPDCERELSAHYENKPLPAYLLLLLKFTLPISEGPTPTIITPASGPNSVPVPEGKRIQALEDKLDMLLGLLSGRNGYKRLLIPHGDNE